MIYNFYNLTFQILTADRFVHKKGFYNVAGRPYASLSFRISGQGNFKINGTNFISSPGDILFIPENQGYEVDYSGGASIAVHLIECNYKNFENISAKNNYKYFLNAFSEISDMKSELNNINAIKSSVYNILQSISDNESLNANDKSFKKCLSFINMNYSDPNISIKEVCRAGNISEATLRRKFQKHYGISPKQYLLKCRLSKAIGMLIRNEYTVKEISWNCGFNDEKFFSKTIKKHYGIPPSKFLKKN